MIFCRDCEIALPDNTVTCPLCQRDLRVRLRRTLVTGGVALFCVMLGLLLSNSGEIKNRLQRSEVTSEQAFNAARSLVAVNPAVKAAVSFSSADQTTVEHWDRRWRVSGYVDTKPKSGARVRTLYFAVMLNNGTTWDLEDLQLQSMEFGGILRRN